MRALVIDDEPSFRRRLAEIRTGAGYAVEECYPALVSGTLNFELIVIKPLLRGPAKLIEALKSLCAPV